MTGSKLSRRKMTALSLMAGASVFMPRLKAKNPVIPSTMMKRTIPSSGEQIPAVGMGTWQTFDVGNNAELRAQRKEVFKAFAELGGRVIDSSPMYATSETVVGDLSAELGISDQLFMATKVWTSGESSGISQMESSMRKMRANPMDLMQIHNLLDWKTHLKTLNRWKEEGKIRYIGLTHYTVSSHEELTKIIEQFPVDFLQINYNLAVRNADKRLLPTAKDKGVAVMINRPYQGGTLFRKTKDKTLPEWAAEADIKSWGQFFLKFILSHPAVTCVIPATTKEHHMKDNMTSGYGAMPDAKMRKKMIEILN